MAGLTSREGEAIKKAIALDTLDQLSYKVKQLEHEIEQEVGLSEARAAEAERILEPKVSKAGVKEYAKGPLFQNMVKGLDEAGLNSALNVVKGVIVEVQAKRAKWLEERQASTDRAGFLPNTKYDRKEYDSITLSS